MSDYHPPLRPTPAKSLDAIKARPVTPSRNIAVQGDANGALEFPLTSDELRAHVAAALREDGAHNDVSTLATVSSTRRVRGRIVARLAGVIAGLALAVEAFRQQDPEVTITVEATDGVPVSPNATVLRLTGSARAILSAERVALNYLQHLSGIATHTAAFVSQTRGTQARILDTRKTLPGWRRLEKYAVRAGGGVNHRMDLQSGVLIKDNHLAALDGNVGEAVKRARAMVPASTIVQVECDTLAQVSDALSAGADWILLDNMPLNMLRQAVAQCAGKAVTEASGGITLEMVRQIAETGVDRISVGALTHSSPALDLALDFEDL